MQKYTLLLLVSSFLFFSSCQEISKKLGIAEKTEDNSAIENNDDEYLDEDREEEYYGNDYSENTEEELGFHQELYAESKKKNENEEVYKKLSVDDYSNNIAKFIAGIDNLKYAELQKKQFYENHKSTVSQSWEKTEGEDLEPIIRWTRENLIAGNPDYQSTLFYPFSGPDILYANAFFPYARNYVLVGLERPGSLPHLDGLSNELLNNYLASIRSSQRYISKHGYFITKQMQEDFSKNNLDGTIHLILYYLARTKHEILKVEEVALNNYGNVTEKKFGNTRGFRIDFTRENLKNKQSVYYFRMDLSNDNVEKNPGLLRFLKTQFNMQTYMKSASYILHDSNFSSLRDFILERSKKLLQDDTGVPYYKLKASNLELQLFGNYTSTIKDFKNNFQPDLKKALDEQTNKHSLPFIVGYSSWLGETLLMYAKSADVDEDLIAENISKPSVKKKEKVIIKKMPEKKKINKINKRKLNYKVQILYSSRLLKEGAKEFKGLKNVEYYQVDGAYKYTIGNENSATNCLLLRKKAHEAGFEDAFIVALFNGKRISLRQAKKISN